MIRSNLKCLLLSVAIFALFISGCSSVKPWQKIYLNDPEMSMSGTPGTVFEKSVENIREGASTPGGTKSGGGCGCN